MIDLSGIPEAELRNTAAGSGGPPQQAAIAELQHRQLSKLLEIAEAQKVLAERLERQTDKLIILTRVVMVFTVVLMVLTVGLLAEGRAQLIESRKVLAPGGTLRHEPSLSSGELPKGIYQSNQAQGQKQPN
jgi:hypothetical protein